LPLAALSVELRKLGNVISKSTVLNILRESGFPGRSRRRDQSWYQFLRSHGTRFFACEFFSVDTAFLKQLYVLPLWIQVPGKLSVLPLQDSQPLYGLKTSYGTLSWT
jgi:hypothetical protein